MKRIIFYTRQWRSGTGLYAQGLAEGMAAAGWPITFIAPAGEPTDPAAAHAGVRRITPPREMLAGPRPRRALSSLGRVAGGLAALLGARLSSRQFLISIPDPFIFTIWPLALIWLSGGRIVYICHDPRPHAWKLPPALRGLERASYSLLFKMSVKVVVLSHKAKAALTQEFAVPGGKILVVPHGAFDVPSVGPVTGSGTLLAFGTIRRNKQVRQSIEAVLLARGQGCPVRLVIAGGEHPEDAGYVTECREAAKGHEDQIAFEVGYIDDARMMTLIAQCDAMLLPYADFDSQSGVAVLAGMTGRPVIAAGSGGIGELMDMGLSAVEIQAPVTAASIAKAIVAFYKTPAEQWSASAAQSRVTLEAALNWKAIGSQMAAAFE